MPVDAFEVLRERGFVKQFTEDLPRALREEKLTVYAGFDPTADSMHVGHLLPVMMLAHLQRAGHRPIALVGGGTARIGDPTGKDEARQFMGDATIDRNAAALRSQLGRFIDFSPEGGALMVDNADWLMGLGYLQFLRDIGRHMTVNTMLNKASVKLRLDRGQGLSFLEFNYQCLQGYDFLELSRRHGCFFQVGGDDQWGNITAGAELIRRVDGGTAHAMTCPLITTATGAKMGKTAAGAVWLDANRLAPYDFYQYWINADDVDVGRFLRLFTFLPIQEIEALERLRGADIREAKAALAFEATAIVHGRGEAARAREAAAALFGRGAASQDLPTVELEFPVRLLEALVASGLCKSRGDARRKIREGAIRMGPSRDRQIRNIDAVLGEGDLDGDGAVVLWRGKKSAARVVRA